LARGLAMAYASLLAQPRTEVAMAVDQDMLDTMRERDRMQRRRDTKRAIIGVLGLAAFLAVGLVVLVHINNLYWQ
jgi:hypothetical protein